MEIEPRHAMTSDRNPKHIFCLFFIITWLQPQIKVLMFSVQIDICYLDKARGENPKRTAQNDGKGSDIKRMSKRIANCWTMNRKRWQNDHLHWDTLAILLFFFFWVSTSER